MRFPAPETLINWELVKQGDVSASEFADLTLEEYVSLGHRETRLEKIASKMGLRNCHRSSVGILGPLTLGRDCRGEKGKLVGVQALDLVFGCWKKSSQG